LIKGEALITRITGRLVQLSGSEATLSVGAFEYEVYVPEFVRRQLQSSLNQEISLRTIEYLEGNPQKGGRLTPRLIGFLSDAEREFFEAICSVDGVGVRTALRAMVRPVREVAVAIEEQNVKELTALPGIGSATAERIIAKLRRKMAKFALMVARELPPDQAAQQSVVQEAFEALVSLGHTAADARQKLDAILVTGKKFKSIEELLTELYQKERR
jgi:Holliday junction DNA helicase RuvA